jgi:CrcB protein
MARFLWVGLGGAIGAIFRYVISLIPWKGGFPVLTLVTNLAGAVLIGVVVPGGKARGWPLRRLVS